MVRFKMNPHLQISQKTKSSCPMGRPAQALWSHFCVEVGRGVGKDHPDASCLYCNKYLANAVPSRNMLKHVLQCERIPAEGKAKWLAVDAEKKKAKASSI